MDWTGLDFGYPFGLILVSYPDTLTASVACHLSLWLSTSLRTVTYRSVYYSFILLKRQRFCCFQIHVFDFLFCKNIRAYFTLWSR